MATLYKTFSVFAVCVALISIRATAQDLSQPEPTTPAAQTRLGNTYLDKKDYASALIWFRKAAEKTEPAAENNLGWLYENGFGIKQDYAEAMNWFLKAAGQRNADAQNNIGWLYQNGWGVKQDYSEAMSWYRKAANQGNTRALHNIGWLYENGLGVNRDYAGAMTWYQKAADLGDGKAKASIGWLYENGFGVKQDYYEAMTWYLQGADKGNAQAQNNIGVLYQTGLGVTQDYTSAMAWYYRAAEQGHAQAQTNLGTLYENGHGVKQDYVAAMKWYCKAAEQGYAQAENHIGWLYQNGLGVHPDLTEATKWYQKAAEHGDSHAKANLEWVSRIGSSGVIQEILPTAQKDGSLSLPSDKKTEPAIVLPGGIHAPRAIYSPDPEYSDEARRAKYSGEVLLSLIVGSDGLPRDIKVLTPLGDGLDEKAVDAVMKWKFEPGTKDGKPVAVQLMIEVNFRLYGRSGIDKADGVGKVETVGAPQDANFTSYLSPFIAEAAKCWSQLTEDKARAPSLKEAQVTVEFAISSKGQVGRNEIASSSGDDALDRGARDCVSSLKTHKPLPSGFEGKELVVRMQLLYNKNGVAITPNSPQIRLGARVQFNLTLADANSLAANWTLTGAGCSEATCGTISPDGLYIAPNVLPDPPYVRVKGMLTGANPMVASTIVALVKAH